MPLLSYVDNSYLRIMDLIFAHRSQPVPSLERLNDCKLIAHRGEHDNVTIFENTMAAFEQAANADIWGIELDVRWTSDLVPVVAHDLDLKRVYGVAAPIAELSRPMLQQRAEAVPSLSEVVARFGGRLHLMIEIKHSEWPDPVRQSRILQDILSALRPVEDFHFMALQPQVLTRISGFPAESMVAIANYRPALYSRWVLEKHWGGLCAHYGLMRSTLIQRHHARAQKVGTAYPASRNSLFRELNRGVDWIFSNNAAELQPMIDAERRRAVGASR